MPNRLASSNSPYLLQHADNPVDWRPWSIEAFTHAYELDKPIFLSIGYAACHWCHVMAHESFEDPQVAAYLNQNFVCIKVDREERPEIDNIYMNAVVSLTGQGGWPLSVFLTPHGEPFYGGTYFPPTRRYNIPSFSEVLASITRLWRDERSKILESGAKITEYIRQTSQSAPQSQVWQPDDLDQAAFHLIQAYDWKDGGWGQAPKFPQAMALDFLLRRAARDDKLSLEVSEHALMAMARGGMYDLVGGGFARYSTDNAWLVPHFEKMLYDNALLARVYLYAWLITGNIEYRLICEETLDFILRELLDTDGGFFSSLDADSEGQEGKFYIWSQSELELILPVELQPLFFAAFSISNSGNFEGANLLQYSMDLADLAEQFSLPREEIRAQLARARQILLEARSSRVRPTTDDKVLVSWNGLAMWAFAEAGRYLNRTDFIDLATRNAQFVTTEILSPSRPLRAWRKGQAGQAALLEDFASYSCALFALYQSTFDPHWFQLASTYTTFIRTHFHDPAGGFFDTPDDHERLILRPKDLQDNAVPCGNSLAALALLIHSAYSNSSELSANAMATLALTRSAAIRYPTGFGNWLCAADLAMNPPYEVAILRTSNSAGSIDPLVREVWRTFRPNLVLAAAPFPPPPGSPPLLEERTLINQRSTAYVCRQFTCQLPVTEPDELRRQLSNPLTAN